MEQRRAKRMVRTVLRWYAAEGRRLPWRNIRDPYRILLAEIMLQQTQAARVLELYPRFLRRFPTLKSLADARQAEVVVAWRGLGYNNRAVHLHMLVRTLVNEHHGRLPRTAESLLALPGIGPYTAHALLVSVYRRNLAVVDVNVLRFLSRFFWRMSTTLTMQRERLVWQRAAELVPSGRAYDWTQALMDLGATICTARSPQCNRCPVAVMCMSRLSMNKEEPRRRKKEPSLAGIPNRIYRGRIVNLLRHNSLRSGIRLDRLGPAIHPAFRDRHTGWLKRVVKGLERDGVIITRCNRLRGGPRVYLA